MLQALMEYIMPPPGKAQLTQFAKPERKTHEHCQRAVLTLLLAATRMEQPRRHVFVLIAKHLWETRDSLRWLPVDVLVTGDDFGYSVERNAGLLYAVQQGSVDRVSLLINHAATEHAVACWTQSGPFDMGIHWNLSEGKPLTKALSFVDADGCFLGKQGFWRAAASADPTEIKAELEAQLDAFTEYTGGTLPTHYDGHQHVHVIPNVAEQIVAIFRERRIVQPLRVPNERGPLPSMFLHNVVSLAVDSLQPALAREPRIAHLPHFVGCRTMGRAMTRTSVTEALVDLMPPEDSSSSSIVANERPKVELMCHVGYPGTGGDDFNRSQDRRHELDFVLQYF